MNACKRVVYSGHVQGVGFRYTAQRLAAGFAVAGFVRNLADGSVELVAEGAEPEVAAFLQRVAERMSGYIQGTSSTELPAGGLKGFQIRH